MNEKIKENLLEWIGMHKQAKEDVLQFCSCTEEQLENALLTPQEPTYGEGKNMYELPVSWSVSGTINVKANSLKEAVEFASKSYNIKLPHNGEYVEDSFGLNTDNPDDVDSSVEELVEYYGFKE